MRSVPRTAPLALTLVAALALTGCSSSGAGAESPSGSASSGSSLPDNASLIATVTKDDALAKKVPSSIAEDGVLQVGSYLYFPPSMFLAEDGKTVVGNDNDIMQAIGKKLGLEVEYQNMDFSALITSLDSKRVEAVMAAVSDTAERQKTVDFVDYLDSGIAILVQRGNPAEISDPEDLCGKSVAVNTGTSQQVYAEQRSKECVADGKDALQVTVTDSAANNQSTLRTALIDALLTDLTSGG